MKMKKNRKGFTLVEVIIAMSVFAVISTGFVMSASYAYKAQVKAKNRLKQSNEQTTNLEDYRGVVDPTYAGTYDEAGIADLGVQKMGSPTGSWVMTYDFGAGGKVTNNKMYGYYSTPDKDDKTFQLAYFSPADKIALDQGEYWITIENISGDVDQTLPLQVTCCGEATLFNNEKKVFAARTAMPENIIAGGGYKLSFGVHDISGTYRSGISIDIVNPMDLTGTTVLFSIPDLAAVADSSHHIKINFDESIAGLDPASFSIV